MKVEIGMVSGEIIKTDLYQYNDIMDMYPDFENKAFLVDAKSQRIIICKNIEYVEEQSK